MNVTRRRPFPASFDIRLLIGAALVVGSIAGVWFVVTSMDRSVAVYTAASTLTPGEPIRAEDLVVRHVVLGASARLYVAPGAVPAGAVATRVVPAGELVPVDAVGRSDAVSRAAIVVSVSGRLPASVERGRVVDVWATATEEEGDGEATPSVLVADAVVTRVAEPDGIVGGPTEVSVEISVPDGSVAVTLAAQSRGDRLALVPTGDSAR